MLYEWFIGCTFRRISQFENNSFTERPLMDRLSAETYEDYETLRRKILEDPTVSNWVKAATSQLENRDPLDAENDVAVLARLMALRSKEALFTVLTSTTP